MKLSSLYYNPAPSSLETWFSFCSNQIESALLSSNNKLAMEIAYDWASYISNKAGLKIYNNWKLFKKEIIKKYFGDYLGRKFKHGWSTNEVLAFLNQFENIDFRISLFPTNIACHSHSVSLAFNNKANWINIITDLKNDTDIEVFQQASSVDNICFRRFTTLFGEEIKYECGFGQAMDVFENEQGLHELASVTNNKNSFELNKKISDSSKLCIALYSLINLHNYHLHIKSKAICLQLGIEWLSIEGYYNLTTNKPPLIVDIDLPFDYVFMEK